MRWVDLACQVEPLTVSVDQISHLGVELHRTRAAEGRAESGLPPVAHKVLVERDTTAYGGDNSRAEYAATLSLLGIGMSVEMIMKVIARYRPLHFARVGAENFHRAVVTPAMHVRERNISRSPEGAATRDATAYLACLDSTAFPGRTGGTDKCVLAALARRMQLENRHQFRASLREIALEAGLSTETVRKSIARLTHVEVDAVRRVGRNAATSASLWCLNLERYPNKENTVDVVPRLDENADVGHDVWHRKALGKSALWVLQCLRRHPNGMLVVELVCETGRCHSTISRSLQRLADEGLTFYEDDQRGKVWYAAIDDVEDWQLNRIAYERGTRGSRDIKTARFALERSLYASSLLLRQMTLEELKQL